MTNRSPRTTVTPEMSAAEPAWWRDDRYAIYDLNVNSAVVYPQHNEVLNPSSDTQEYTVKGYAYSGGGRRVTRVEISLDSGKCESNDVKSSYNDPIVSNHYESLASCRYHLPGRPISRSRPGSFRRPTRHVKPRNMFLLVLLVVQRVGPRATECR